jgi:site-specific recombinase XerD
MLLSKGFQDALQYLGAVKGYSRATLSNYERTGQQFIAFLRAAQSMDAVSSFTSDAVMDWVTDLGARGAQANTVLNKLHGLSTLARFLMKRKNPRGGALLASNPTQGFDHPESVTTETKFLYPDELAAYLGAEAPPHVAICRDLFLDTGIRCAEACEADVGDVRELEGAVYLTLAVKGRRRQGEQPASIPLSADCAARLVAWLRARGELRPDDPLLVDGQGRRWKGTQLSMTMVRLGVQAGIRRLSTSPHKLRHTANVIARQSGVDALTRAKMLNHRSLKTLARYDHLVPGETARGREQQRRGLETYLSESGKNFFSGRQAFSATGGLPHGIAPQDPESAQ